MTSGRVTDEDDAVRGDIHFLQEVFVCTVRQCSDGEMIYILRFEPSDWDIPRGMQGLFLLSAIAPVVTFHSVYHIPFGN